MSRVTEVSERTGESSMSSKFGEKSGSLSNSGSGSSNTSSKSDSSKSKTSENESNLDRKNEDHENQNHAEQDLYAGMEEFRGIFDDEPAEDESDSKQSLDADASQHSSPRAAHTDQDSDKKGSVIPRKDSFFDERKRW